MENKVMRKCPVCGCDCAEKLERIILGMSPELQKLTNYPDFYDVVACQSCGMIYADIGVTNEDVEAYYANHNMYDMTHLVKYTSYDRSTKKNIECLAHFIDKNSRIVDIGCGGGDVLCELENQGFYNLWAVDPSKNSIESINKNEHIHGVVGSAYDTSGDTIGTFDCVIFTCVLEHMLNPNKCMKNLVSLLDENGVLYITVPNADGFADYLAKKENYFNYEHINYFTAATLDTLCKLHGLSRISPDAWTRELYIDDKELTIIACYKKDIIEEVPIERDLGGRDSVLRYFKQIREQQEKFDNQITKIVKKYEKIVIWGTGSYAGSLMKQCPMIREKVLFFVDNDRSRWGKTYFGRTINNPEALQAHSDAAVIICIMQNPQEVEEQMHNIGLENCTFILQ